jgi:low temperature requirement protein LtrA
LLDLLAPRSALRDRPAAEEVAVGPIELLFDWLYVFTIIQLSQYLLERLTWRGALETTVLFLTVWSAWNYSARAMNWLNPDARAGAAARRGADGGCAGDDSDAAGRDPSGRSR